MFVDVRTAFSITCVHSLIASNPNHVYCILLSNVRYGIYRMPQPVEALLRMRSSSKCDDDVTYIFVTETSLNNSYDSFWISRKM